MINSGGFRLPPQPDPSLLMDVNLQFKTLPPLNPIILDIETCSLNPRPLPNRILLTGLKWGNQLSILNGNEIDELKAFCDFIYSLSGNEIIVGHNIMKFDLPYIMERCKINNIRCPFVYRDIHGIPLTRRKPGTTGLKNDYNTYVEISCPWVKIVDTMHLVSLVDAQKLFKNHKLKNVAIELGIRDKQRLELTAEEIISSWKMNDGRVQEYLKYDLEDTEGIFYKLYPLFYEQLSFIPDIDAQQVILSSTAGKIEKILKKFYVNVYPETSPTIEYEGAYTEINPGIYRNIQHIDVSSLYPSIMIQWQITTNKDPCKLLPAYLKEMLKLRLHYKKTNKDRSDALKILINSAYGFLASDRKWNCPEAAAEVTRIGRIILYIMIDAVEDHGGTVIECDTDGIFYSSQCDIHEKIQALLPNGINIEHKNVGDWGFFYKSKNYFINKIDGGFIDKGIFRKRDTPIYQTEFIKQYTYNYLYSKQQADNYYESFKNEILSGAYPVEKLSATSKIRSNEKTRLQFGSCGDRITTYYGYDDKGKKLVTITGPYNREYYVKLIDKIYKTLMDIL